jgi:hypothetical protein
MGNVLEKAKQEQVIAMGRLGRSLWDGNGCKKVASGGKWGYIGYLPKGKTEIPVY